MQSATHWAVACMAGCEAVGSGTWAMTTDGRHEGLWAFYRGRFFGLTFDADNRDVDHITWFEMIDLPRFGSRYDQVVRGRFLWDAAEGHYVLSWYALPMLPNRIYQSVLSFFEPGSSKVLEKPVQSDWVC